ncbi:MAG: flavodoxin domain-containing protein [Methanosarcinales archaeon]|nr:flavodoxin domain-containing protein [Methanosarcinales archaeon]
MGDKPKPFELTKGVYWVGVVDWNLRDFHGYVTSKGTTYNAYLIVDEKIALVDTVKSEFSSEMLMRISQIIDPAKIDYVIANHVEMDHSGSLPAVMEVVPNAPIYCTKRGCDGLSLYYHGDGCEDWHFETVETGTELSLGSKTLMFIEATMLHWPDSMHTYLKEDKILLSNDAFGQHIATSKRFNDEVDDVLEDAAEYYANILMPFGQVILKYVDTVGELGIDIDMIAPCHGIIWRDNPARIIEAYGRWARGENKEKVLIIYDTMWGSTYKMANAILEGVKSAGVEVKLLNIRKNDQSKIIKEVLDAPVFFIGSPTLNNGMFPSVGGFLTYLKGLRPRGKKAVAFGSYGWGKGAVKGVESELKAAGFEIIEPGLEIRYRPDEEGLASCRSLGERVANIVKEQMVMG